MTLLGSLRVSPDSFTGADHGVKLLGGWNKVGLCYSIQYIHFTQDKKVDLGCISVKCFGEKVHISHHIHIFERSSCGFLPLQTKSIIQYNSWHYLEDFSRNKK